MGLKLETKTEITTHGLSGFDQDWPEPGHYQFAVTSIDVQGRVKNGILVGLETLAGEVPGQEGKTPELYLWYDPTAEKWSDNSADRVSRFFWACGIIEEGTEGEIEPDDAIGKSFIGKVAMVPKPKSPGSKEKVDKLDIEGGCYWRVGHGDVKDLFKTVEIVAEKPKPTKEKENAPEEDDGLGDL